MQRQHPKSTGFMFVELPAVSARNRAAFTLVELPAVSARNRAAFTLVELPAVSARKRAAFTLVELLVVIGIIGVLLTILLPALSAARNSARQVKCMSNLRQIAIGVIAYTADAKGAIPYIQSWSPEAVYTNQVTAGVIDSRPLLLAMVNDYHVFYCPFSYNKLDPDDPAADGWNGNTSADLVCSYDLVGLWVPTNYQQGQFWNAAMNTEFTKLPVINAGSNRPKKLGGFQPEDVAIATDLQHTYSNSQFSYPGFTSNPYVESPTDYGFPHRRRDNSWDGTTTVFFDGHAEYKTRELLNIGTSYPWNGQWLEWAGRGGVANPVFW